VVWTEREGGGRSDVRVGLLLFRHVRGFQERICCGRAGYGLKRDINKSERVKKGGMHRLFRPRVYDTLHLLIWDFPFPSPLSLFS
jgi:hypothetical protein